MIRIPSLARRGLTLLSLAAPFTLPAAETAPESDAVSLPPFFVESSTREQRWYLATGPDFELLTTNDTEFARGYARQYYQQLALVRLLVPERYQWKPFLPTQHLVVGTDSRRQETDAAMQEAINRFKTENQKRGEAAAKTNTKFLPNLRISGHDSSAVFAFQDEPERDTTNDSFAMRVLRPGSRSGGRDTPGFHFTASRLEELLSRRTPALPAWFIAGMTRVYRNCFFSDDDIQVATLVWESSDVSGLLRRDADYPREMMVLPDLLSAPPPAAPARRAVWERQSELFVRWALFADEGKHREALWSFVDRLEVQAVSDKLFQRHFGFGLAEARDRLSDYLNVAVSETFELAPSEKFVPPEIVTRRADPAEVARIKGEWERLETAYVRQHVPSLVELYLNRARGTVHRARQNADTPELKALAGLIEYEADNFASARTELEAAVAAGIRRPRVLQALANLRFRELRARYPQPATIPAEAIGAVTVLLDAAVQTDPPIAETYLQLVELWLNTDATPDADDLAALAAGTRAFPQWPTLVANMAILQAQRGQPASALQIIGYARARVRDAKTAQFLDTLHAQITAALGPR